MSVETCPLCDGSGVIDEQECATCYGEGLVNTNITSQISGRVRSEQVESPTQRDVIYPEKKPDAKPDYDYGSHSEPNYGYSSYKIAKQDKRVATSIISSIVGWFFFGYIGVFFGGLVGFLLGGRVTKPSLKT